MRAYVAGPLFNASERSLNAAIAATLESLGVETYLPQRDGGLVPEITHRQAFDRDVFELRACDFLVANLEGHEVDSGTAFESGFVAALGKPWIGYRTDSRTHQQGSSLNTMLALSANGIACDETTLGWRVGDVIDEIGRRKKREGAP
jgi:nucleoside 2-deoxyribosyltransferase